MAKESETTNDIEKIIRSSGHNLHTNVVETLNESGYQVEISPYYVDAHTDKPREVDVIARKDVRVYGDSSEFVLKLSLAIDCKYMNAPVVFWTFPNEKPLSSLKLLGINVEELTRTVGAHRFAYLNTDSAARLFQTGNKEGDSITDPVYKACSQAISGTIFALEHTQGAGVVYPIVVVDGPGKFYDASTKEELNSVLLHVDYSYYLDRSPDKKPKREPFFVWLIRKEHLGVAMKMIETEVEAIRSFQEGIINERRFNQRMRASQSSERARRDSAM